jgi:hypothetical protein
MERISHRSSRNAVSLLFNLNTIPIAVLALITLISWLGAAAVMWQTIPVQRKARSVTMRILPRRLAAVVVALAGS